VTDSGIESGLTPRERALLMALRQRPRAPVRALAEEMGCSERTVTRYLTGLRERGVLKFAATLLYERFGNHLVAQLEITCAPQAVAAVAARLAKRSDTRFVGTTAGTQDVVAEVVASGREGLANVLTGEIARIPGVRTVRTSVVLDLLLTANDWNPDEPGLSLWRRRLADGIQPPTAVEADEIDLEIESLLREDVRMSVSRMAARMHIAETTAHRRLQRLLDSETIVVRVVLDDDTIGFPFETRFGLQIRPDRIKNDLRVLALEPSLRTLYLVAGHRNVVGFSAHRTLGGVTELASGVFGKLSGLLGSEIALVMDATKRTWAQTTRHG